MQSPLITSKPFKLRIYDSNLYSLPFEINLTKKELVDCNSKIVELNMYIPNDNTD